MLLESFTLERWRCFVEPTTIELRPLTVFFGRNSAGKSAALRALPILAESFARSGATRTGPLALEHEAAMGARYEDIRTRLHPRNEVGVVLRWNEDTSLEYHLRDMSQNDVSRQVVLSLAFQAGKTSLSGTFDADRDELVLDAPARGTLHFDGLRAIPGGIDTSTDAALTQAERLVRVLPETVRWLGPVRALPPRARVQRVRNPALGPRGEQLTEVLASPENEALLKEVSEATCALFDLKLELGSLADEVFLQVTKNNESRHVLDVGAGITQVLPALVRLAMPAPPIVAIEQPEAHLHPDAEVALARFIASRVRPSRRLLIETHSENLLLSLQLQVLEKNLAPDDVALYWFTALDDGSVRAELKRIDARGRVDPPLPPGAFSSTLALARKLVQGRSRG